MCNTKVIDIYKALKEYNIDVTIYDPWANPVITKREYGVEVTNELPIEQFDTIIMAVAHNEFKSFSISAFLKEKHVVFDVKHAVDRRIVVGRL